LRHCRSEDRFVAWDCGERRLCFFRLSRRTPRYVLAVRGSDGCELLSKYAEKENNEVVGSVKGNGMIPSPVESYLMFLSRQTV
jgi:hypothetical protein